MFQNLMIGYFMMYPTRLTSSFKSLYQRFVFRPYRAFGTLIVSDTCSTSLTQVAIQAATQLPKPLHLLLLRENLTAPLKSDIWKTTRRTDLEHIYTLPIRNSAQMMPEAIVPMIQKLHEKHTYSHILGPICTDIRDVLPRLAACLNVQPLSDIVQIHDANTYQRLMYAGNVTCQIRSHDPIQILSIRPTCFTPDTNITYRNEDATLALEEIGSLDQPLLSEWIREESHQSDRPQLGSSRIVVSGGRALKSSKAFEEILQPLCDQLGAALGATRAAVDAGFVPNDIQIGQTGKIVAPDLYLAIGISGAIQHVAGMKDSKIIVAINKDADCPIFTIADYGMVGDLFQIVPQLTQQLQKAK